MPDRVRVVNVRGKEPMLGSVIREEFEEQVEFFDEIEQTDFYKEKERKRIEKLESKGIKVSSRGRLTLPPTANRPIQPSNGHQSSTTVGRSQSASSSARDCIVNGYHIPAFLRATNGYSHPPHHHNTGTHRRSLSPTSAEVEEINMRPFKAPTTLPNSRSHDSKTDCFGYPYEDPRIPSIKKVSKPRPTQTAYNEDWDEFTEPSNSNTRIDDSHGSRQVQPVSKITKREPAYDDFLSNFSEHGHHGPSHSRCVKYDENMTITIEQESPKKITVDRGMLSRVTKHISPKKDTGSRSINQNGTRHATRSLSVTGKAKIDRNTPLYDYFVPSGVDPRDRPESSMADSSRTSARPAARPDTDEFVASTSRSTAPTKATRERRRDRSETPPPAWDISGLTGWVPAKVVRSPSKLERMKLDKEYDPRVPNAKSTKINKAEVIQKKISEATMVRVEAIRPKIEEPPKAEPKIVKLPEIGEVLPDEVIVELEDGEFTLNTLIAVVLRADSKIHLEELKNQFLEMTGKEFNIQELRRILKTEIKDSKNTIMAFNKQVPKMFKVSFIEAKIVIELLPEFRKAPFNDKNRPESVEDKHVDVDGFSPLNMRSPIESPPELPDIAQVNLDGFPLAEVYRRIAHFVYNFASNHRDWVKFEEILENLPYTYSLLEFDEQPDVNLLCILMYHYEKCFEFDLGLDAEAYCYAVPDHHPSTIAIETRVQQPRHRFEFFHPSIEVGQVEPVEIINLESIGQPFYLSLTKNAELYRKMLQTFNEIRQFPSAIPKLKFPGLTLGQPTLCIAKGENRNISIARARVIQVMTNGKIEVYFVDEGTRISDFAMKCEDKSFERLYSGFPTRMGSVALETVDEKLIEFLQQTYPLAIEADFENIYTGKTPKTEEKLPKFFVSLIDSTSRKCLSSIVTERLRRRRTPPNQ